MAVAGESVSSARTPSSCRPSAPCVSRTWSKAWASSIEVSPTLVAVVVCVCACACVRVFVCGVWCTCPRYQPETSTRSTNCLHPRHQPEKLISSWLLVPCQCTLSCGRCLFPRSRCKSAAPRTFYVQILVCCLSSCVSDKDPMAFCRHCSVEAELS